MEVTFPLRWFSPVNGVIYVGKGEFEAMLCYGFPSQTLPSHLTPPVAALAVRTTLLHLAKTIARDWRLLRLERNVNSEETANRLCTKAGVTSLGISNRNRLQTDGKNLILLPPLHWLVLLFREGCFSPEKSLRRYIQAPL